MNNPLQQLQQLGQSVWYDNIRRGMIKSGELQRLIDLGVSGLTSNPTIFEKAIAGSADYDDALMGLADTSKGAGEVFEALALEDIQAAADLLRPIYERSGGADGFASLEVSPHLARDTEGTVAEAQRLFAALGRRNVMIKVPATPEGIPAIRSLIGQGINVNVTLTFSLDAYDEVRQAYVGGLEDLAASGGDVSRVASVASFFVSRVDTAVDAQLDALIRQGRDELRALQGKAAVANAKLAYRDFKATFGDKRFASLTRKGARVQRPLWASTSTKNPAYSDVLYVENLIGPDTVNTMPEVTLTAFLEHGNALVSLDEGLAEAEAVIQSLEKAGISMERVTDKLLADGVKSFADSYDKLLENIADKKAKLAAQKRPQSRASLGSYAPDVEAALADLQQRDVVARIWRKDHTVWSQDPTEIADRLGWLTITDAMRGQVGDLNAFAAEARDAGFRHVVLLGMGGSSLGPEVLRQAFGSANGFSQLIVLDSTVPAWVNSVTDAIDPAKTLFIVSSKSGTTTEPNVLYRHFRAQVEQVVGKRRAGRSFAAITDAGTPLEALARKDGFRRAFANPPDLGGRYSVLSYFGLVPAALSGLDIAALMDRTDAMRARCASAVPARDNPGAWLGAVMGTLALRGRDKLTLVTSPSIDGFGLWVEQLIAESTGKGGQGIVPVAGEPLANPQDYGGDRLFVYLRLEGDANAETDAHVGRIESAGHPVVRLELRDRHDLGSEFFRWEFATAVAGSVLGINPFDQPDVERAKRLSVDALKEYETSGRLPAPQSTATLTQLLSTARPGDYLAIMAYLRPDMSGEVDAALSELRRKVMVRYRIATTVGYGPRFLHSTGQLHKGGPESGLFLQITAGHGADMPIPGRAYTFGVLAEAQALGDLSALQAAGRRVARVTLKGDPAAEVRRLADALP